MKDKPYPDSYIKLCKAIATLQNGIIKGLEIKNAEPQGFGSISAVKYQKLGNINSKKNDHKKVSLKKQHYRLFEAMLHLNNGYLTIEVQDGLPTSVF